MKLLKTLFASMLAVACMAGFTACSDDDEPEATPVANAIAGSYNGPMTVTVMGQTQEMGDLDVTISAASETEINIALPSFGEGAMTLPAITFNNLKVSGTEESCTIAAQEFKDTADNGTDYTATVAGTSIKGVLTLNIQLQYGKMPMPMNCQYIASKK